jgi:RTX calcium-binding nonapeptide repeat (4 copies)
MRVGGVHAFGRRLKRLRSVPLIALIGSAVTLSVLTVQPARAQSTVTIFPDTPDVGNCIPFGGEFGEWTPFAAFFYKNIPAFELKAGDLLAFDLGVQNDFDIQLDIALARTTTNGGTVEAQPFQAVVANTQTPANPRGDTTVGNFELQFTAQAPFSFPGGGLIIRFSNPGAAYMSDGTCDQVMVSAEDSDTSGFFVQRATGDADGISPWSNEGGGPIGAFQVQTFPAPPPPTVANPKCKGKTATIFARPGLARTLSGTNGRDVIVGTNGKDTIKAKGGNDTVCGKGGKDTLKGGGGKDKLYGQGGKDNLLGQGGKDLLSGGGKNDTCVGGAGKDTEKRC